MNEVTGIIEACEELSVLLGSKSVEADHLLDLEETISKLFTTCEDFLDYGKEERDFDQKTLQGRSRFRASRKTAYRTRKAINQVLKQLDCLYSLQPKLQNELAQSCRDLAEFLEGTLVKGRTPKSDIFYHSAVNMQKNIKYELTLGKLKHEERERKNAMAPVGASASKDIPFEANVDDVMDFFPFLFSKSTSGIHKVLVIGKEGAGKTHLCNEIERSAVGNTVYRPHVFGRRIGELEDNIHALLIGRDERCHHILLMDDFDDLVCSTDHIKKSEDNLESHASARALFAFMSALDSFCTSQLNSQSRVTLICTVRSNVNQSLVRFDTVYTLDMPSYEERRSALSNFVKRARENLSQKDETALDHLAELSVGLSRAEIAQSCRRVLSEIDQTSPIMPKAVASDSRHSVQILEALKVSFQSFTPASLRSGVVDGYVDMRVRNGEDLLNSLQCQPKLCPLFGDANEVAWKELESNIVIPLCRVKDLHQLLFDQLKPSVQGELSCGVVLTGPAGSGKSTLARHCAAFAASFLPSVKLLEVSCTSMIHKEVGASEKAIRHLFECARSAAPCVLILDDVATVASVRGKDDTTEGTMDRVLSTLLTELDGVEKRFRAPGVAGTIAVIGVTQNVNWVDPALLRPGRFSRIVRLESPDREAKRQIALRELTSIFLKDPDDDDFDKVISELAELIADQTEGTTGSSVVALCNDAKQSCIAKYACAKEPFPSSTSDILASMRSHVLQQASRK